MSFFIFLLEVVCCQIAFYGFYHFVLRNDTSFQFNRFYLLTTSLLAIVLPLLDINLLPVNYTFQEVLPWTFEQTTMAIAAEDAIPEMANSFTWLSLLQLLYVGIMLVLGLRLGSQLFKTWRLSQSGEKLNYPHYTLVQTDGPYPVFSFMHYIFWQRNSDFDQEQTAQIMAHEEVHVRQWHSIDILILELMKVVLWISPITHLYKKSLKELHEFIADEAVIQQFQQPYNYAQLISQKCLPATCSLLIANTFFQHQIKRRLMMISERNSKSNQPMKRLLILPLLAFVFLLVSCSKDTHEQVTDRIVHKTSFADSDLPKEPQVGKCYAKCSPAPSMRIVKHPVNAGEEPTYVLKEKQVLVQAAKEEWVKLDDGSFRMVKTPAVYETKTVKEFDETVHTLATDTIMMVDPEAKPVWEEIVCEDDMTPTLIKKVQTALNNAGYETPIDGAYNDVFKKQLKTYQDLNELPGGSFNIKTLNALGVSY